CATPRNDDPAPRPRPPGEGQPFSEADPPRGLAGCPVAPALPAVAGGLGLRAGREETRHVEPDIEPDRFGRFRAQRHARAGKPDRRAATRLPFAPGAMRETPWTVPLDSLRDARESSPAPRTLPPRRRPPDPRPIRLLRRSDPHPSREPPAREAEGWRGVAGRG